MMKKIYKQYEKIKYNSLLKELYFIINDKDKIITHTTMNMVIGKKNDMGYNCNFLSNLNMSYQSKNAFSTLYEILYICYINNIDLYVDILLNNNDKIIVINEKKI